MLLGKVSDSILEKDQLLLVSKRMRARCCRVEVHNKGLISMTRLLPAYFTEDDDNTDDTVS